MRSEFSQHKLVAAIFLTAISLFSLSVVRAQSVGNVSDTFKRGVAVLKNGQTMAGEISRQDNKVILQVESGSRIYLARDRVLFTAATLSEAYWELAARTGPTDLAGQVKVFQWCLRNELFEEGANHLLVLQESKIPARRLSALDLDLQAKKKRSEFRREQTAVRARRTQQLAQRKMEEEARKNRVAKLIGDKTRVTIPDLHHVPARPIRGLRQSSAQDVVAKLKPKGDPTVDASETIDQFGNRLSDDQASQDVVRQVSYEQPIFSTPAITLPSKRQAAETLNPESIQRPTHSDNSRSVTQSTGQLPHMDSAFSATKNGGSNTSIEMPKGSTGSMADPFDADYFNRRFASPAVTGSKDSPSVKSLRSH